MTEASYRILFNQIEAQIADSDHAERGRLRLHLDALRREASAKGIRIAHRSGRPEQDRIEDEIEAQFDNFPV